MPLKAPKRQQGKRVLFPGPQMAGAVSKFGMSALGRMMRRKMARGKAPTASPKIINKVIKKEAKTSKVVNFGEGINRDRLSETGIVRAIVPTEKRVGSSLFKLIREPNKIPGPQKTTPIQRAKALMKKPMPKANRERRGAFRRTLGGRRLEDRTSNRQSR